MQIVSVINFEKLKCCIFSSKIKKYFMLDFYHIHKMLDMPFFITTVEVVIIRYSK